jgi:hypothetical protein
MAASCGSSRHLLRPTHPLRSGCETVHALAHSSHRLPVKRAYSRPPDGNPRTGIDPAGIETLAASLLADSVRQTRFA